MENTNTDNNPNFILVPPTDSQFPHDVATEKPTGPVLAVDSSLVMTDEIARSIQDHINAVDDVANHNPQPGPFDRSDEDDADGAIFGSDDYSAFDRNPPFDDYNDDPLVPVPITANDLFLFRERGLHGADAPMPNPNQIRKDEFLMAHALLADMDTIESRLNVKTVELDDVTTDTDGAVLIPRPVALIYKSLMYNLMIQGNLGARWGSWWKGWAFGIGAYAIALTIYLVYRTFAG